MNEIESLEDSFAPQAPLSPGMTPAPQQPVPANASRGPLASHFKNKKAIAGVVLGVIVLVAGWFVYRTYFAKPAHPAKFTLSAKQEDAAGTQPNTSFTLRSDQPLSTQAIKKIVKFSPEADFSVKKVAGLNLIGIFIKEVFAANAPATSSAYELTPQQPLAGDSIYTVAITNPDYADREYSWAFQIKAPFQIIKTFPANKGTFVPINSGVELTFNREGLTNPENYFEINPRVSGRFEVHDDTLVFVPSGFAESKVYTVTVRKGLGISGSEDKLDKDFSFSFETSSNEGSNTSYFDFQNDFAEFLPSNKPALSVYYYNFDPGKEISLADVYRLANGDDFITSYQNSRNWEWGWTNFYRHGGTLFDPGKANKVASFKPNIQTVNYQNFFELPQALAPGYYVIDVTFGQNRRQMWLQITDSAHYFSLTHDKGFIWLYDFSKKAPIAEAKASFVGAGSSGGLGITNAQGLVEFSPPQVLQDESGPTTPGFFKLDIPASQPVYVKVIDGWYGTLPTGDQYWKFISVDRPVYQVSDTVKIWGVAKGRTQDLREKKLTVGLFEGYYYTGDTLRPDNKPLVSADVLVSNFDTFQGELHFQGLRPQTYSLVVLNGTDVVANTNIEVQTYTKPAYQLTTTVSKDQIFAGQPVEFKVKAAFFDGTPVPNMTLDYRGYWNSDISGQVKLNQNGEASVALTPEYIEGSNIFYPRSLMLSFAPQAAEEGEIYAEASVLVFGPHMYLQGYQDKQQGTQHTFKAKLNDIVLQQNSAAPSDFYSYDSFGPPVSGHPLSAKIIKVYYTPVETGDAYDPINKIVYKLYRYEEHRDGFDSFSGTTDNNGEWIFQKDLPKLENGYYLLNINGQDREGRKLEVEFSAYGFGVFAGYQTYDPNNPFAVDLRIVGGTKDEIYSKDYSVGEQVNLTLGVQEGKLQPGANVLFYRYQNNISRISIQQDLAFSETFGQDFLPNVQYRAVVLGPYGFVETNSIYASYKEEDRKLNIDIKSDKDAYKPGEQINIDFAVTDKDKRGVRSELNVAAVDEAIFHVLPYDYRESILPRLYQNIYVLPLTGASYFGLLGTPNQFGGAEKGGCFLAGTQILMANGRSKPIEQIRVGDEIVTRKSDRNGTLAKAVVQGISSHMVGDYLIINQKLRVTPEHTIFSNGSWKPAGNVHEGDTLLLASGASVPITSLETVIQPNTEVYNIVVGNYHTYFADNFYVHNAEKGGSSERSNFLDTATYEILQTDENGKAHLSFTSPDNITSWRVTAQAFDPDNLKAGDAEKLVKTTLPFFVEATMNQQYLVGDRPTLRVRVFGTGLSGAAKDYSMTSDTLKLNAKQRTSDNEWNIPLGALPEGDHALHIAASQGDLRDGIVRTIHVAKSYFKTGESQVYTVASSLTGIAGNQNGFTELLFSDAGRGRYYAATRNLAYGGVRSDQQAASFAARQLLVDYFGEDKPESLDLGAYQTGSGGIALFSYSDPELELSAKVADLVPDMVYRQSVIEYFRMSLKDEKTDIHRQALAYYGLASLKASALVLLKVFAQSKDLTPTDKLYVALAFAKFGDLENARMIYFDALQGHLDSHGPEKSLDLETDITKKVKLTASMAELSSLLGIKDDTAGMWEYLQNHYPERDLDVLERVLILRSELSRTSAESAKFSYTIGDKTETLELKNGQSFRRTLSLDDLARLRFSGVSGQVAVTSYFERGQDPAALKKDGTISVSRAYMVDGKATTSFRDGDIVRVVLTPQISSQALEGEYQVVDFLPSGLKPITQPYSYGLSLPNDCNASWYPSVIENNALYFNVYRYFPPPNCSKLTINYFARVVSKGDFGANPALIQSTRDLNVLNISPAAQVEIK